MKHNTLNFRLAATTLLATTLFLGLSVVAAAIPKNVTLAPFFTGTTQVPLNKPLYFAEMPGKPGHYVVLEQHLGRISVLNKINDAWTKTIMDTVVFASGVNTSNEMGLLGIAFHPEFAKNRKYYLNYNPTTRATHIVERKADTTLIKRDTTAPSRVLLNIVQPYSNHNGGTMNFGPKDGYLYIGMGDGGSLNDPQNRAQNLDSLLGKFLRIDVNIQANGKEYGIPADNPFVGTAHPGEIYAYGARNPFKWNFDTDPATGTVNLWLGHVGEQLWEWATLVPKGANLGWKIAEGGHCFSPSTGCNMDGIQPAFTNYPHTSANADSMGSCIIGGYVYRGNPASPFYGVYFYGDNGSGRVWTVRSNGTATQEWAVQGVMPGSTGALTSFGTDLQGNLYAVARGSNALTATNGTIYALTGPDLVPASSTRRTRKGLAPATARGFSDLELHDLQGRRVLRPGARKGLYIVKGRENSGPAFIPSLD
jgi:glucose/arabinose dehydrogenase